MEEGNGGGGGGYVEFDVPEFSSSVLSQLNELRLQGKLCDIIVHIQGQPFRAHKAVLAASSPYFRDHSALGTMSGMSISIIKNPEVFEQLLAFCYTGRMALRLRDVISFLTAASFLQMQAVIDKCTQILEGLHANINLPAANASAGGSHTPPHQLHHTHHHLLLHHHRHDDETPPPADGGSVLATGSSLTSASRDGRNGVKDGGLFLNPTQISPPYYGRSGRHTGVVATTTGRLLRQVGAAGDEGQSDRGSSDGGGSEQDACMEAEGEGEVEGEQVELIGRDGQVTDVHVKLEKPSQSDSSSTTGDDGYHTELVDGEQVVAVSVGSYGPVITAPPAGYSYAAATLASPFLGLASSPSRSLLGGYRGGRGRSKRIPADVLSHLKPGGGEEGALGEGEGGRGEGASRGQQWYPFNERLICIYCGKSFNQKGSLDRHMRLHMGITPFVCKFCGKKYTRKDQLEYHIRGHTDNKPFHCHICGKCFPFQGTLNQHLRKKHMGAGGAPTELPSAPNHHPSQSPSAAGLDVREVDEEDVEGAGGAMVVVGGDEYADEPLDHHDNAQENARGSPE